MPVKTRVGRRVAALFTLACVVGILIVAAVVQPRQSPQQLDGGVVVAPQTLSQIVARCTGEYVFPSSRQNDRVEDAEGSWALWETLGVVSSPLPHSGPVLNDGVYYPYEAPELSAVRASLDGGALVVWYDPGLARNSTTALANFVSQVGQESDQPVSMVPLPENLAGPLEYSVLLTERGRFVGCVVPSQDVLEEFAGLQ